MSLVVRPLVNKLFFISNWPNKLIIKIPFVELIKLKDISLTKF